MSTHPHIFKSSNHIVTIAAIIMVAGLIISYLLIAPMSAIGRIAPAAPEVIANNLTGQDADAIRYTALSKSYESNVGPNTQRGHTADAARYTALADLFAPMELASLRQGQLAYAARYDAQANSYVSMEAASIQRSHAAEGARYTSLADVYLTKEADSSQRGQAADAARYATQLKAHRINSPVSNQRGQAADAGRYTALATFQLANPLATASLTSNRSVKADENFQRGNDAEAARYAAWAKSPTTWGPDAIQLSGNAQADRYTAMAARWLADKETTNLIPVNGMLDEQMSVNGVNFIRGLEADTARYTAQANFYLDDKAADLQRGNNADAVRYTAQAEAYIMQN